MKLDYTHVCDAVYAATALATLSGATTTPLLHPDHADALRVLVGDTVALIVAQLGTDIIEDVQYTENSADIRLRHTAADTHGALRAFEATVAAMVLALVKIAASDDPGKVVELAANLHSAVDPLVGLLTPPLRQAKIKGCF